MIKKKALFLTLVFFALIFVVGSMTVVFGIKKIGYRVLVRMKETFSEEITVSEKMKQTLKEGELAFSDNLFLQDVFAGIDVNLKFFLTREIESTQVLFGKEGWLFYKTENDGDPIADYTGDLDYSKETKEKIKQNLLALQAYVKEKGAEFVFLVPPNKEQIYKKYMPDYLEHAKISRSDRLLKELKKTTNLKIIDPKPNLLRYADRYPLYYRLDSHWNQLGAFLAEQDLLFELYGKGKKIENQTLQIGIATTKDLVDMIHMNWYFGDEEDYFIERSGYQVEEHYAKNREAKRQERVLLIGDSFRTALEPHLFYDFSWVYSIKRENVDLNGNQYIMEAIEKANPDLVILECTERYLKYLENLVLQ